MRGLTAAETSALNARVLAFRNLVWLTVKDRTTNYPISYGFWNGEAALNLTVLDGLTQLPVQRPFVAAGALLTIDDIELTSDMNVREVRVRLSPIDLAIRQAAFSYDMRFGAIQIYRALLNTTNNLFVAPARPRFVGFIDKVSGIDPAEGQEGYIELTCASQMREMTRSNPEVGSNDSQHRRDPNDDFLNFVNTVSKWKLNWGITGSSGSDSGGKVGDDKKGTKKGKDKKNKKDKGK
jgi:hypothetical protein